MIPDVTARHRSLQQVLGSTLGTYVVLLVALVGLLNWILFQSEARRKERLVREALAALHEPFCESMVALSGPLADGKARILARHAACAAYLATPGAVADAAHLLPVANAGLPAGETVDVSFVDARYRSRDTSHGSEQGLDMAGFSDAVAQMAAARRTGGVELNYPCIESTGESLRIYSMSWLAEREEFLQLGLRSDVMDRVYRSVCRSLRRTALTHDVGVYLMVPGIDGAPLEVCNFLDVREVTPAALRACLERVRREGAPRFGGRRVDGALWLEDYCRSAPSGAQRFFHLAGASPEIVYRVTLDVSLEMALLRWAYASSALLLILVLSGAVLVYRVYDRQFANPFGAALAQVGRGEPITAGHASQRPIAELVALRTDFNHLLEQERATQARLVENAVQLTREVAERRRAEDALRQVQRELEQRVQERTAELRAANRSLEDEVGVRRQREELLAKLESIINRSPAMVLRWRVAEGWPVEYASESLRQLGYSAADLLSGRVSWIGITHPDDAPRLEAEVTGYLARGVDEFRQEYRLVAADGRARWMEDRTTAIRNAAGEVTHFEGIILDVTERTQAEQALRSYAGRLEIMREIDQAILEVRGLESIGEQALQKLHRLVPFRRASIMIFDSDTGDSVVVALHSDYPSKVGREVRIPVQVFDQARADLLRQGYYVVPNLEQAIRLVPAAVRLWAEGLRSMTVLPLNLRGELIGSLNLFTDAPAGLTEEHLQTAREVAAQLAVAVQNVRLFRAVADQGERLRLLASRLAEAQEEDRRELAKELHDQMGASLTVLGINLNLALGPLRGTAPALEARLTDAIVLVEQLTERVRHVTTDLQPPGLSDYGLSAALRWYVEQYEMRTGLGVRLAARELLPRLPTDLEVALFRILQEALTNVAKHAGATTVEVVLTEKAGLVRLSIADNGSGFDPKVVSRLSGTQGLGLMTMQERATGAGGELHIRSSRGNGTTVTVEVRRSDHEHSSRAGG